MTDLLISREPLTLLTAEGDLYENAIPTMAVAP